MDLDIKAIREKLGLTREEFAALVPVDPTTVWRWENGTSPHPIIHERIRELSERPKRVQRK